MDNLIELFGNSTLYTIYQETCILENEIERYYTIDRLDEHIKFIYSAFPRYNRYDKMKFNAEIINRIIYVLSQEETIEIKHGIDCLNVYTLADVINSTDKIILKQLI